METNSYKELIDQPCDRKVQEQPEASAQPVQQRLIVPLAGVLLLLVVSFSVVLVSMQQRILNQSSQQILEDASDEPPEALNIRETEPGLVKELETLIEEMDKDNSNE